MIKKKEIIAILIDHGLSPIEADRVLDTKDNFRNAIKSLWENSQ